MHICIDVDTVRATLQCGYQCPADGTEKHRARNKNRHVRESIITEQQTQDCVRKESPTDVIIGIVNNSG